ncbi:hypothetical protein [Lacticaseibacillus paracasei]|uniref:hypothetical protein n=1 Tax=Lacticaseibacillus paracasei TaxID=1597 RepID=UPI0021CFAC80|nr:hypothetical protein [Lacticaseibacillus paracasei]MCU6430015.1 hypothetical protein [Lacticaseibacillus paracasei]
MRQYGIKGLAALGMLLVMLGMPSGSAESEPMPLKANHVAAVYEAKKVRPLFQQLAVFPDGTQQPLAGGIFAFYRFDSSGRRRYRTTDGHWRSVGNPLTSKEAYKVKADRHGIVASAKNIPVGTFYSERLLLPRPYATKMPLPVKIHVKRTGITANGQAIHTEEELPRIYAFRVAVTRQ